MTEDNIENDSTKKRFELRTNYLNGYVYIIDWDKSEQKDALCIFNNLGVLPFSSGISLCKLLNQLNDDNNALKASNEEYEDALARLEEEIEKLENKLWNCQNVR